MKASEAIERIKELAAMIGGDPEVVVYNGPQSRFESACWETQFVRQTSAGRFEAASTGGKLVIGIF